MRTLLLLLPVLVLAGCQTYSTGTHGDDLSAETASLIRRGMSMSEVGRILGTPTHVTMMNEGRELWTYRYLIRRENRKVTYVPIKPEDNKRVAQQGAVYVLFLSTGKVGRVDRG